MNCRNLLPGIAVAVSASNAPALAANYTFFDPSGSIGTNPAVINNDGIIAGYYEDQQSHFPGFVRAADGTITAFSPNDAVEVLVLGINDKGWLAGKYDGADFVDHGFIRKPNGHIITIDAGSGAIAAGINKFGDVCGQYSGQHGFLRTADGTFVSFDPPDSEWTASYSINISGTIAGFFSSNDGHYHGFMRAGDGTFTEFDVPNSQGTFAYSINVQGSIAGTYWGADGVSHGFVRDASGTFTSFDAGKKGEFGVEMAGAQINDKGVVAGYYTWDSYEAAGGYVRRPNRRIRSFYAPGGKDFTFVTAINNYNAVTGEYSGHGFLRTP
jgi:hypothetical protein